MSELKTRCGPFELENPFLLASAPPSASLDLIRRAFIAGWGGAVTKTVKPDGLAVSDVSPRFSTIGSRRGEVYGLENVELVSKRDLAYWLRAIRELKAEFPGKLLIASMMGDCYEDSWKSLAFALQEAGADGLELNFSCPHGMPEMGVGAAIGQNAEISGRIASWVRSEASVPIIVKLTPNVADPRPIARAAIEAGADMLAAINTVESLSGVDLDTFEPQPAVGGRSTYGGFSGRAVKPIGLRVVSQLARAFPVPIMGMGGIGSWSDAAEYLAVGASAVQVCTEVMVKGFGIVDGLKSGLLGYMDGKGFSRPDEFRGRALAHFARHEELPRSARMVPEIDDSLCVGCGRCAVACRDGGYQAIAMEKGRPEVAAERCDGCSLCVHVCPAGAVRAARVQIAS